MKNLCVLVFLLCCFTAMSFQKRFSIRTLTSLNAGFPKPIHKVFTVEKATEELKESLNVKSWPTWSTVGSEKYKVGLKSPQKVSVLQNVNVLQNDYFSFLNPNSNSNPNLVSRLQKGL